MSVTNCTVKSERVPFLKRKSVIIAIMVLMLGIAFIGVPAIVNAADPTGADTLAEDATAPVNMVWTLIAGFLVFFMQLGFGFFGAGLIRSKNTVNYWTKSFMDFCIASLGFWAFGFAIMFGGSNMFPGLDLGSGFMGYSGFFLGGNSYDVSTNMFWFFQMVFAATACTIVAGAVAGRMKITAYLAYSFVIGAIIYPVYGHWIWGGGWLSSISVGASTGVIDFAGSGVVHMLGGLAALIAAAVLGPRIGKFNKDGTANIIKGHSVPFVVIGTFILFFGWFGFNAGSTVAATDLRISVIVVNTFLAAATGSVVALYWKFARTGKADILAACNGCLAGLVAITASCAFVPSWAAVLIGAIAVPFLFGTAHVVEKVLKVDDAVGAVPVHFGAGIWGLLSVAVFADGTYGGVSGIIDGNWGQLGLQLLGIVMLIAWVLPTVFALFWLLKKTMGLRASREEELGGLDIPEHGLEAYPAEEPVKP